MNVDQEIGFINGRLAGHDEEIGGMREQLADIHHLVGTIAGKQPRIEEKLDKVLGSAPQVALRQPTDATEPKTASIAGLVGGALQVLNKPIALHAIYLCAVLL